MRRALPVVGFLGLLMLVFVAGCSLLRTLPAVDFDASVTEGMAPLAVQFTPQVEGIAVSYAWSFGDGQTSDEPSPVHVYRNHGTYSVMLTVGFADAEPVALVKKRLVTVERSPAVGAAPSYLYWITEGGSAIKRGAPGGGTSEQLVSQSYFPVSLDVGHGKVFWVTNRWSGGTTIDSMDLDGSNHEVALTEDAQVEDIAVDVQDEKVYWTCRPDWPYDGALKRANLDFTDVEILTAYPAGSHVRPGPVVVDSQSGTIYWSETAQIGQQEYQTMITASSTKDFAPYDVMEVVGPPRDIALDTLSGFSARNLYYTVGFELRRARLDGTSDVAILSELYYPWGVEIDPYAGRIYVGTYDGIFVTDDEETVQELYPDEVGVRSVALGGSAGWPESDPGRSRSGRR